MYRNLFLIFSLVILVGCTSNTIYKKPKDLIPEAKMVNILTDMYLANAASGIKNKNLEKKINYMPLVYEKYGVDSLQFQHSNTYYVSRLDDYKSIYEKVETRLKKMLDTTLTAQKIRDSLRVLKRKDIKKPVRKDIRKPLTEKKPDFLDKEQE